MSKKTLAGYPMPDSRTADKFVVRLPEGMRDDLRIHAETTGHSMNVKAVLLMKAGMDLERAGTPVVDDFEREASAGFQWVPAEKQVVIMQDGRPGTIRGFYFDVQLMAEIRPVPGSNWEKCVVPVSSLTPLVLTSTPKEVSDE